MNIRSAALALRREWTIAAVVLLAAFLRLFELQFGQYGSDDERLWVLALRALASHSLPNAGIRSSIGTDNGPFQAYLIMPAAALFAGAPLAGAVVVALLNAAAVLFLSLFVRDFFGRRPALIAALLFATTSWAVVYSRRLQAQDMLVPFQLLFFWSAARWLVRGRGRDLVLMLVWLAVLTQVYVLGYLHVASAAIILLLGWRHIRWRSLLLGGLIALALSARYLQAVLLPGAAGFGNVLNGTPRLDADSLILALTMATHKGFQTIAGQAGSVLDATSGFEGAFLIIEEVLCAAGFVCCVWGLGQAIRTGKADRTRVYGLLMVWALVPVGAFARHAVPLYPYYFVSVIPLPAIFIALLLSHLKRAGPAIVAVLTANSLAMAGIFFAVIPGYFTQADYGLPYQYTFQIAPRVQSFAASQHTGRVYVDGNMDPSEVMASVLIRAGLDVFWLDDYRTPEFAAPASGDPDSLYLTMADNTDTAAFLRGSFAGRQVLAFPLPGEGVTIRAYQVPTAGVRAALDQLLPEHLDLDVANGMRLLNFSGDRRLEPGSALHAAVSWAWRGGPKPGDTQHFAIFGHLVDGDGKEIARADHPLQLAVDWKANQVVVQWLDLPIPASLPPGRYGLEIGIYDQDANNARQTLRDAGGKQIGDSVVLGPFVVPPATAAGSAAPPEATLGDGIALESHSLTTADGLHLDLTWQAEGRHVKDYTVFVHVLDANGRLLEQADSQPRGGAFPTSTWLPGDRIGDAYSLPLAPDARTIEVGMYDVATLERLGPAFTIPIPNL